jgi:hypothetical protein
MADGRCAAEPTAMAVPQAARWYSWMMPPSTSVAEAFLAALEPAALQACLAAAKQLEGQYDAALAHFRREVDGAHWFRTPESCPARTLRREGLRRALNLFGNRLFGHNHRLRPQRPASACPDAQWKRRKCFLFLISSMGLSARVGASSFAKPQISLL